MKKLILAAGFLLALVSATGCASLMQSLATTPSFTIGLNNVLYDGITARVTKVGSFQYDWEVSNSERLEIVENEDGTTDVTGFLPEGSNKSSRVIVKAYNATDETIKPVEQTVTILPWTFSVYDAAGNWIKNPANLKPYTIYTLKMTTCDATPQVIEKVVLSASLFNGEKTASFKFSIKGSGYKEVDKGDLFLTFRTPSKPGSATIEADADTAAMDFVVSTRE